MGKRSDGTGYLTPNGTFGCYTVLRLLGRGGMGEVYLIEDASGAKYAAKVMLPPEEEKELEWCKRFIHEAQFAMEVRHPNIVAVHDVGEDPETGLCYIIMDYAGGGSLSDRLKKNGAMQIRDAIAVASEIASALDAAHKAGVVHRDIKPDNILFDDAGHAKLADLGIAKFSSSGTETTTVTKTGTIVGTPAYMAPEQMMDSHNVDGRADIYSLGLVLYEMLTGARPNAGSTIVELLAKAVKGEELPDIRTVRPEVSASLAYVIALMVAPKPESRPGSADDVAKLLEGVAAGKIKVPKDFRHSRTLARKKPRRRSAIVLGVGLAFLGGFLCAAGYWSHLKYAQVRAERQAQVERRAQLEAAQQALRDERRMALEFADAIEGYAAESVADCEKATSEIGQLLLPGYGELILALLKPAEPAELIAARAELDSPLDAATEPQSTPVVAHTADVDGDARLEDVPSVVNDLNAVWKMAYEVQTTAYMTRRKVSQLVSEIDDALGVREVEDVAKSRDLANSLMERYSELKNSPDIGKFMKRKALISSRLSRIVEKEKRRLRNMALEEERNKAKNSLHGDL